MGCSVQECENPHYSKGFCISHYRRWRKYGDPLESRKPGRPRQTCNIDGCDNPCAANGLCDKHRKRKERHGDPLALERVRGEGDEARWWFHVDRRGDDECWPWKGFIDEHGSARFWDGKTVTYAPRWGYEHFVAPIPGKGIPDHRCHDPKVCSLGDKCPHRSCCNWRHLEPVTNRENVLRGGSTKLTDESVAVLYRLWKDGSASGEELAAVAGVHKATLYRRFKRMENDSTPG